MERDTNLRDLTITPDMAKSVFDTKILDGLASDSLSGKNVMRQYDAADGISKMGPFGGMPSGK